MAVTFTLVSSYNHVLKYKVTSAGAEAGNLDAATLLTDCALQAGTPLYDVLATATADQPAARALAFDRSDLKISILQRSATAAWIIDANANALTLRLTMTAAAAECCWLLFDH